MMQGVGRMRRREFLGVLGGVAAAWPRAARAQQAERMRRVGVLLPATAVDPVGAGFVNSLARPGGNATGFMNFEYSLSGKWLELLKEIAPGVTRVAILRDPTQPAGTGQFGAIQAAAPSLRVEVSPVNTRDPDEIELAVAASARAPNGGLIVTASAAATLHRDLIVALAAGHKLPAVYSE